MRDSGLRRAAKRAEARLRAARGELLTRTRLGQRANLAQYRYAFSPAQLWVLCQEAERGLRTTSGAALEIGVWKGETTVYLLHHLADRGVSPERYIALDTFGGFTLEDVSVEDAAGRDEPYESWFVINSLELFRRSMELHGLQAIVDPVRADAATFDYSSLPPLGFALIDVDLERPVAAALEGCWTRMAPGGRIVVDDCGTGTIWEGARAAYLGFCADHGLAPDIREGKLGLLEAT